MWWTGCRTRSLRWERRASLGGQGVQPWTGTGRAAAHWVFHVAHSRVTHARTHTHACAHAWAYTPSLPQGAWLAPSSAADREGSVKAWQAVAAHGPTQAPPKPHPNPKSQALGHLQAWALGVFRQREACWVPSHQRPTSIQGPWGTPDELQA